MPQYLVAIHHPDSHDPSKEDAAMDRAIDDLNDAMVAAGVRVYVNGLKPPREAKSLRANPDGSIALADGPYLPGSEHVAGFWVLNCATEADAIAWGRKAVIACKAPVEVRPFWGSVDEARAS